MADSPAETLYDEVAYPSAIFLQTHPNRLAVLARIHGLAAPDVETARVLEIGGGDGLNMIAMATAWPNAHFVNVDLAAVAVARGNALIERAGLTNVINETGDILDLCDRFDAGSFDYVIAHGVYAWVPDAVRAAIPKLIAHVLSPTGVAFVSYNTLPGGHIRQVMRNMLLHALDGVEGHEVRLAAAEAFLTAHEKAKPDDDDVVRALRRQSAAMLSRPRAGLFHDELGPWFAPQSLTQVVAAAADHGLEFLTDSGTNRTRDGLLSDDQTPGSDPTAQVVRRAQSEDYEEVRFFRQTVLVRSGRSPQRQPDLAALRDLYVAGVFEQTSDGELRKRDTTFVLRDASLTAKIVDLSEQWPHYRRIGDLVESDAHVAGLLELWHTNLVYFSMTPERFVTEPGSHPTASPLVRAHLAMDMPNVCSLHHEPIGVEDPAARTLLAACDGTRDRAALTALWAAIPHNSELSLDMAIGALARQRLMIA